MTPAEGGIWGRHPGQAFPGTVACTAPAPRGWGKRRAVHDEMPAKRTIRATSPPAALLRLRPARALATRTPAPAREPYGRAGMVLFAGEGVPPPSPSPGGPHIPHGTAYGIMPTKCTLGTGIPGRPFPGYRDYCPRPRGRGRSAEGAGGVGEIGEQCMKCRRIVSKIASPGCALPGLSPREPPLLRGNPVGGLYGSF